jgi:hypothetical protein
MKRIVILVVPLFAAALIVALGAHSAATEAPSVEAYVPGLGEFMTAIQLRHAKLWFAGAARNWDLAAYELDEIKEGFEDAAKFNPTHDGIPVAAMIRSKMEAPLAGVAKAIEDKESGAFVSAFDGLTSACNACHAGAEHGFIRIQRPAIPPVGNQIYGPVKD